MRTARYRRRSRRSVPDDSPQRPNRLHSKCRNHTVTLSVRLRDLRPYSVKAATRRGTTTGSLDKVGVELPSKAKLDIQEDAPEESSRPLSSDSRSRLNRNMSITRVGRGLGCGVSADSGEPRARSRSRDHCRIDPSRRRRIGMPDVGDGSFTPGSYVDGNTGLGKADALHPADDPAEASDQD